MIISTTRNKINKFITALLVVVFWVAAWWVAAEIIGKEIVLPTPLKVAEALWEMGATSHFWKAVVASFGRIVAGYAIGCAVGVALALAAWLLPVVGKILSPAVNVLKAAPVASFTILAMMWFKSATLPLVLSAVMVMPMLYSATLHAAENIDIKLVEMGKVFRLSDAQIFFSIKLRSLVPHIVSSAASALGFAWKAGIAAEVICRPKLALGAELYDAKQYLEMPAVFAVTAVTVVLSILLERLLKKVTASMSLRKGGAPNGNQH